ncbi:hypothetical protein [Dyadobacter psychrotolerans]|uniref:Uncharacterized protein n=1 Tax=Dyadobacter psychrotolerans TaxID=2541721 RepID=A0A4R5E078_9BACT|nr:hypothetical protein [Dyadobacter psychrotolerans]TDE17135.1 hypothetical protein E0F88_04325 [Dyadobacter psychrotolerans]
MKTTIKLFAVLCTASFLFSCQEPEVTPVSNQVKETSGTPRENITDMSVKENVSRPEEVTF